MNSKMKTFNEIKKILEEHKSILKKQFKVNEIGIFGSFVRGEQREGSDLDILVDFKEDISLLELVALEIYLTELLRIKVDVIPKADLRPELKDEILMETAYV